jgi:hypothetical protein
MGNESLLARLVSGLRLHAGTAAAVSVACAVVVACATGGDATTGDDGTLDGDASVADPDTGTIPEEDAGIVVLDSSSVDDTGVGPLSDASSGDASAACGYTNMCNASRSLGQVSGDTGGAPVNTTGTTSEWLTIYVTEDDNGVLGTKLSVRATLDVAAGTSYALYIYRNGNNSMTPECSTVAGQSTAPPTATQSQTWGEGTVANGSDDGQMITVRVEHLSGPCDASHPWSLVLEGNI